MRALGAGGFVQSDIGFLVVLPKYALHHKRHIVRKLYQQICLRLRFKAKACVDFHQTLLNQASANAAGAEALRKKQIGKYEFLRHIHRMKTGKYRECGKR